MKEATEKGDGFPMDYRKVIIPLSKDYPVDVIQAHIENGSRHTSTKPHFNFHDCLEISLVTEGQGWIDIEDRRYSLLVGDLFIINNLERHILGSNRIMKTLVILFDPAFISANNAFDFDYLKPFFNRDVLFSNKIRTDNSHYQKLVSLIRNIQIEWANKEEGHRLVVKALLLHLLSLLYRYFKEVGGMSEDLILFQKNFSTIQSAYDYIGQHFCEPITLEELAKLCHMNKTYFSQCFRQVIGMTISDYIKHLRISKACTLIRSGSDWTMSQIAMELGFNSSSHFGVAFKQVMGQTPTEYKASAI